MTEADKADQDCEDKSGLRDGRCEGETESKFDGSARRQIVAEALLLILSIFVGVAGLAKILWCVSGLQFGDQSAQIQCVAQDFCTLCKSPLILTSAFFLSGLVGGALFSLKWLYHTVAKNTWHKDRFLWRISVPIMGAVLGVFVTYLFARTFGTSFAPDSLKVEALLPACGFSFLVGVFADGAIASLERLARSIFGTLENFNGSK